MENHAMNTGTPETTINIKQGLLGTLVPLIVERIGRGIDQYEKEAIAFVVEESFKGPAAAEDFLSGIFGVKKGEADRDVAMKIHNSVYETKMRKIDRLIDENPSDSARLKEVEVHIGIGHNRTQENYQNPNARIYIGNVQEDWIPAWFK